MFSSDVPIKSNCSLYKLIRKDGVIIHNDVPRDFINYKVNIGLKRDLSISSRQRLSRKIAFKFSITKLAALILSNPLL